MLKYKTLWVLSGLGDIQMLLFPDPAQARGFRSLVPCFLFEKLAKCIVFLYQVKEGATVVVCQSPDSSRLLARIYEAERPLKCDVLCDFCSHRFIFGIGLPEVSSITWVGHVNLQLGSHSCFVSDTICFESGIYISCYMFCEKSVRHARLMDVLRSLVVPISELNTSVQGQINLWSWKYW
jgi:hypothetical protein